MLMGGCFTGNIFSCKIDVCGFRTMESTGSIWAPACLPCPIWHADHRRASGVVKKSLDLEITELDLVWVEPFNS